jgi:hypothetical protein
MIRRFALILACGLSLFSFGVQASPVHFAPMQKAASNIILVWDWNTGREISTGIEIDPDSFDRIPEVTIGRPQQVFWRPRCAALPACNGGSGIVHAVAN